MTADDTWSWPAVTAELRTLVAQLRPDDALAIVRRLVEEPNETHIAPLLAGMIRGSVARRDDEAKRRPQRS